MEYVGFAEEGEAESIDSKRCLDGGPEWVILVPHQLKQDRTGVVKGVLAYSHFDASIRMPLWVDFTEERFGREYSLSLIR